MRRGRKQAKLAGGRRLDGRVRAHGRRMAAASVGAEAKANANAWLDNSLTCSDAASFKPLLLTLRIFEINDSRFSNEPGTLPRTASPFIVSRTCMNWLPSKSPPW